MEGGVYPMRDTEDVKPCNTGSEFKHPFPSKLRLVSTVLGTSVNKEGQTYVVDT
jgi:hypothetical protein